MRTKSRNESNQQVQLDLQALRYLFTRPALAQTLWSAEGRNRVINALSQLHGEDCKDEISTTLAKQAVATYFDAMATIFHGSSQSGKSLRAKDIIKLISIVFTFEDDAILLTNPHVRLVLLQATIHASLKLLLDTQKEAIRREYRTVMDLVRTRFSDTRSKEVEILQKQGICAIKQVTVALHKSKKGTATMKAVKFLEGNPVDDLVSKLRHHSNQIEKSLPPLHIPSLFKLVASKPSKQNPRHSKEKDQKSKKIEIDLIGTVPDYFSDANIDSESLEQSGSESLTSDQQENGSDEIENGQPGSSAEASNWSQEIRDRNDAENLPEIPDTPRRRSKRLAHHTQTKSNQRYKHGKKAVDGQRSDDEDVTINGLLNVIENMDSSDFSGSDSDQEMENPGHVMRHAHARSSKQRIPLSRKSPRKAKAKAQADNADPNDHVIHDMMNEEESSDLEAEVQKQSRKTGGSTMKELYDLARNMNENGPPDPLSTSVAAAARARGRESGGKGISKRKTPRRKRAVSPIPESSDEDLMPRKSRKNMRLRESLSSPSPRHPRRAVKNANSEIRTGRFQPFEDEWLLEGLRKYGWAQWALISENFGDKTMKRTAMSLKDRARTLSLNPSEYPVPNSHVKRGRPPEHRLQPSSSQEEIDDDDDSAEEILDQGKADEET